MKHLSKVALSASVMIVAAQAMAVSAKETDARLPLPQVGDIAGVSGLDVFSREDVQFATSRAFREIVSGYEIDGETILDRYHVAQTSDFVRSDGISDPSERRNVASCHNACHGAGGGYC